METFAPDQEGQSEVPEGIPDPSKALAQVFLLGPIRIFRGGQRLEGGWRRKSLELLAYLAVHRDGVAKDHILEALWPETDPADSQRYFWRAASYLRCRLRGEATDQRILWQVDDLYRLDTRVVWVDVQVFERAIAWSNPAVLPESFLRLASDIYKDDFCEDYYYMWSTWIRESLRSRFIEASRRLSECLLKKGNLEGALLVLDRALDFDPYDEELARRAMRIEGRIGRRDLAVRRFRRLQRLLMCDLGVEPSHETVMLIGPWDLNHKNVVVRDGLQNGSPSDQLWRKGRLREGDSS